MSPGTSRRKIGEGKRDHDEPTGETVDLDSLVVDMKLSHLGWLPSSGTNPEVNEANEQKYVVAQARQIQVIFIYYLLACFSSNYFYSGIGEGL